MRTSAPTVPLLVLGLAAASCTPPPVGYQGPLPSRAAQQSLVPLFGRTLPAGSVAFCPHELTLHSFLVMPNMPAVLVDDPGAAAAGRTPRYWIPVLQDGDIADLHRRVTGQAPAGLSIVTSDSYRRMMTGR